MLSDEEILVDLVLLTKTPEVVTLLAANTALSILNSLIDSTSSSDKKEDALQVLSYLSEVAEKQPSSPSPLGASVSSFTLSLSEHSLDTPSTLSSSAILVSVSHLSASS